MKYKKVVASCLSFCFRSAANPLCFVKIHKKSDQIFYKYQEYINQEFRTERNHPLIKTTAERNDRLNVTNQCLKRPTTFENHRLNVSTQCLKRPTNFENHRLNVTTQCLKRPTALENHRRLSKTDSDPPPP